MSQAIFRRLASITAPSLAMAAIAMCLILASLWQLHQASSGVAVEEARIGSIPARVFRHPNTVPSPVVVVAHGFAGSQQLMQSFALGFAQNGYTAVTFDFAGHGRNAAPLTGSITEAQGATRRLVDEMAEVARFAKGLGDGRVAVLGHSMASDIVVRHAQAHPETVATIAVSMFSPVVTATTPRNLLVIVGDWEGMLKTEALRAIGLSTAPALAEPGITYGDMTLGTGRRAAFSPHVEHASVLFSQATLREALAWLDASFVTPRASPPVLAARGPWIMLLLAGAVLLAWPASQLLPRIATTPLGAGLGWRKLWRPLLVPMVATPLLLRVLPTHFLPVLVGDYLAAHFALYGLITIACLAWQKRSATPQSGFFECTRAHRPTLEASALAVTLFGFAGLVWPINSFVTSFMPGPERAVLILAMLVGTLLFILSDEWLTRGAGAARLAYAASKLAFMVSLALAVALDFHRLFFLLIIVPVILLFFVVHGLFSAWCYRQTGHPFVAGIANAVAFAWAIGVTFPLLAG